MSKTNEAIRYVYIRTEKRLPVTVAYAFDDEGKRIVYNYARCSKRDQFTKAIGRTVATGRLLTGSLKHPNQLIDYSDVEVDGKVKYKSVAARFYQMFSSKKRMMTQPAASNCCGDTPSCCVIS